MSNFTSVHIVSPDQARELAEQYKSNQDEGVRARVRAIDANDFKLRITHGSGQGVESTGVVRGSARLHDPDQVRLPNGLTTSVAAAINAGLIEPDGKGGYRILDESVSIGAVDQKAGSVSEDERVLQEFNKAYDVIEESLGREEMSQRTQVFIDTGDIEAATEGMDPKIVKALTDGYAQNASKVMSEVGIDDVYWLDSILDDDDTQTRSAALRAIVTNDVQAMRSIAYDVVRKLHTGEGINDFLGELEDLGVKVIRGQGYGTNPIHVLIPGHNKPVTLLQALRDGLIVRD